MMAGELILIVEDNEAWLGPPVPPRRAATGVALALFGSRWEQLSAQFLGEICVVTATAFKRPNPSRRGDSPSHPLDSQELGALDGTAGRP